jgi:hypothetical protein
MIWLKEVLLHKIECGLRINLVYGIYKTGITKQADMNMRALYMMNQKLDCIHYRLQK